MALALICAASILFITASAARAQETASQPLLFPGNAVVTGFSGTTTAYSESDLPENSSVADETFLNTDGAALRVIELEGVRTNSEAATPYSPQLFDIRAAEIGQVFGVALDDAKLPDGDTLASNIYVTPTSAYGLYIVGPDADGDSFPERLKVGAGDAKWMPGLFGSKEGSGPGSVWKIDGVTGEVSLFANIEFDGSPNSGPGLGNIAFDPASRQLFVSDRDTGMIHGLDLQGQDRGTFDHGLDGRPARGLHPVGFDPDERTNITSNEFIADDPETWGYASPERRVWGLAIYKGRLYYAVAEGPQIWSVAINKDGSFGRARWEIDLPEDIEPYEVSDITFTSEGRMVLAQRAPVTGAYDYVQPIAVGGARVLRYRLEKPPRRRTPSRWLAEPDEYAIGQTGEYRNTDGGVAIGYGYTRAGNFNYRACRATLWTTGDRLKEITRRTLAPRPAAATEDKLSLDGLQGNAVTLVRPENEPPTNARFVDHDGAYQAQPTSGHVGDIEIPVICDPEEPYTPPPPPPPAQRILDLEIEKKQIGVCSIFDICSFEITIRNRGTETYRGPLVIRDLVSQSGMSLVGFGAVPWRCVQTGVEISCRRPELVLYPGRESRLYVDFRLLAKILIPGWRNCSTITWLGNANDEATIRAIQLELSNLGFYAGPIDGDLTPATSQAIKDLEVAAGLPETGLITPELLEILYGPGAHRVGDANSDNDHDCADVEYIAVAAPGPGPGQGPGPGMLPAALKVTIGGPAECPFGEECPLGLTIRNNLPVPFDQEIDGLVELKRLGVQVPEQIAQWPSFCAGPVGQMDVNCRFRLQLGPNQARSYPMRLNIQNALLDPSDAANQAPDGVVRAEACFAAEDLGWFGWLFGQEIDRDCHSFVVPEAVVAPGQDIPEPEDGDWVINDIIEFAKKGPANCNFREACTFEVTFRNTTTERKAIYVQDIVRSISVDGNPAERVVLPIVSIEPQLCDPEPTSTAAEREQCLIDALDAGERRSHRITIDVSHERFDPQIPANRGADGQVMLQNCFGDSGGFIRSCVTVPVVAPQAIADDAPADEEQAPEQAAELEITKTARKSSCRLEVPCLFDITVKNAGFATTGDRIRFIETFPEGLRNKVITSSDGSINCSAGAQNQFVCTGGRDLAVAPGQEFKLEAVVVAPVGNEAPGLENCVTLDSDGDGVADANEQRSCAQVKLVSGQDEQVRDVPEITLTKRPIANSCKPGIGCWFEIVLTNNGKTINDTLELRDFVTIGDSNPGWQVEFGRSSFWQCEAPSSGQEYAKCTVTGIGAGTSRSLPVKVQIPELADLPIPLHNRRELKNCARIFFYGEMIKQACTEVEIDIRNQISFLAVQKIVGKRTLRTSCPERGRCEFRVAISARGERGYVQSFTLIDQATKIGGGQLRMPIVDGGPGCSTEPTHVPFNCRRHLSLAPIQDAVEDRGKVVVLNYTAQLPDELKAGDKFENCFQLLFSFEGKTYRPVSCTTVSVTGPEEELDSVTQDLTPEDEPPVSTPAELVKGALSVRISGPAECPFGEECRLTLGIRNLRPVPFNRQINGLVQLKRLGVAVPEKISQWPRICPGPVDRMNVDCRFRLKQDAVRPRSWPDAVYLMRLDIQNPLLDPSDTANRGPDGVVRAEVCFAVKDLVQAGQEIDRDCHSFVVPDRSTAAGGPDELRPDEPPTRTAPLAGRFGPQLSVTKVAESQSCTPGDECSFSVSIANRGVAPYFGPLVFSDRMKPGNVRLVGADPNPWRCRGSNGRFTCSLASTRLDIGATKTVRLRFRTAKSARGSQNNCAQITWRDSTSGAQVVAAKQALAELGFDPGPLDGRVTRQTRNAIRSFQRQQKTRVSGTVDPALMKALVQDWGQGDQNAGDDSACADVTLSRAPDSSTPITCPQGQRRDGNACVPICTGGRTLVSGRCECRRGQVFDTKANRCRAQCASGTRWDGKQCVSRCPEAERWDSRRNRCVNRCSSSQRWDGKRCVARCTSAQRWDSRRNRCVNRCTGGKQWRNNRCQCPSGQTEVRGKCTKVQTTPGGQTTNPGPSETQPIRCTGGKVPKNGKCVCPTGQVEIRGKCTIVRIQPGRTIQPNLVLPR